MDKRLSITRKDIENDINDICQNSNKTKDKVERVFYKLFLNFHEDVKDKSVYFNKKNALSYATYFDLQNIKRRNQDNYGKNKAIRVVSKLLERQKESYINTCLSYGLYLDLLVLPLFQNLGIKESDKIFYFIDNKMNLKDLTLYIDYYFKRFQKIDISVKEFENILKRTELENKTSSLLNNYHELNKYYKKEVKGNAFEDFIVPLCFKIKTNQISKEEFEQKIKERMDLEIEFYNSYFDTPKIENYSSVPPIIEIYNEQKIEKYFKEKDTTLLVNRNLLSRKKKLSIDLKDNFYASGEHSLDLLIYNAFNNFKQGYGNFSFFFSYTVCATIENYSFIKNACRRKETYFFTESNLHFVTREMIDEFIENNSNVFFVISTYGFLYKNREAINHITENYTNKVKEILGWIAKSNKKPKEHALIQFHNEFADDKSQYYNFINFFKSTIPYFNCNNYAINYSEYYKPYDPMYIKPETKSELFKLQSFSASFKHKFVSKSDNPLHYAIADLNAEFNQRKTYKIYYFKDNVLDIKNNWEIRRINKDNTPYKVSSEMPLGLKKSNK
ncbi:MAG: hypothetical protein CL760_05805 [Chloroflexi bacterium]|nr:hypothetical protein [Chloroflexota bacterium]|tara:strand:- start:4020 stop:5693 length:1674 start_codon:yes stop_codon:yes gene_type:complete